MTEIIEGMLKECDRRIARWHEIQKKVEKLVLPKLPDCAKGTVDLFGDMNVTFPYNPAIRKEVEKIMEEDGWDMFYSDNEKRRACYAKEGVHVEVTYALNHPDATCVRTKIGETEQTVSIFEITCKEGAEEKTFIHKEVEES